MTAQQLRASFLGLGILLIASGGIGLLQGGYGFALGLPAVVVGAAITSISLPLLLRLR